MTEMAPEENVEVKAGGKVDDDGMIVTAELPGASIVMSVTTQALEEADNWTYLVHSFPQTVDAVLQALHAAKNEQDETEDIDADA